jgi:hypothetical protein
MTLTGWYSDPANRIDAIQFGQGESLTTAQIDGLVQAMSAFAPGEPNGPQLGTDVAAPITPIALPNSAVTLPMS